MTVVELSGSDDQVQFRRALSSDSAALVELHGRVYRSDDDDRYRAQVADLLERRHPTFDGRSMTVAIDRSTGAIVSSAHLSRQQWRIGDGVLSVGEIEDVATDPRWEGRGLVRRQIALLESWSRERGDALMAINGIPWLYTRFGFDLTLPKRGGRRLTPLAFHLGPAGAVNVRRATEDDLATIDDLHREAAPRSLVSSVRTLDQWRFELNGRSPSPWHRELWMLDDATGPIGFVSFDRAEHHADAIEIRGGDIAWLAVLRDLAHALGDPTARALSFEWITHHPMYDAAPEAFLEPATFDVPGRRAAWYTKVLDPVVAVESMTGRWSDVADGPPITINRFDRPSLALVPADGTLRAEPWTPVSIYDGDVGAADDTFDLMLFGIDDIDHLERTRPYRVRTTPAAADALRRCFPVLPSQLLPQY